MILSLEPAGFTSAARNWPLLKFPYSRSAGKLPPQPEINSTLNSNEILRNIFDTIKASDGRQLISLCDGNEGYSSGSMHKKAPEDYSEVSSWKLERRKVDTETF